MTKLAALQKQLEQATQRLAEALQQPINDFIRDAAIQRFEFCFDLSWKTLKAYLEEHKGIVCQSPKDCFRQAYTTAVIEYDEFWMTLVDARNRTVHTYNQATAEEVFALLPKALKQFKLLISSLANKSH